MTRANPPPLLAVEGLAMRFGGVVAIDNVSFQVKPNEIAAIIGPNGAGKTTVFNCLSGFYRPTRGRMRISHADGEEFALERLPAFRIAREARVVRTFQTVRLFAHMSVLENLIVAQDAKRMRAFSAATQEAIERARYWLDRVGLLHAADDPAGQLSYGAQRLLEIARAMCACPRLLCLDEPAAGLNMAERDQLSVLIGAIRADHDAAILLIEHDMSLVMGISDSVIVLDHGLCIAAGAPAEVSANADVIRAYLGEPDSVAA